MEGYKCDKCEGWFEGTPKNQGHHEWMFGLKPIYSVRVVAKVILRETDSHGGQDLCKECTIECIQMFLDVWKDRE